MNLEFVKASVCFAWLFPFPMNFQLTEQIKRENLWSFDNKCSWNGHVSNRLGLFDTYRFPPQKYISYIVEWTLSILYCIMIVNSV